MKVFLGGTCAGWKWRDELQPLLKCDYYNPIVKNWSKEDRLREVHERETSDYVLYGITNGIKGVYSIAEVVDDSNKRPEKTIFLNLYKTYERSGESKQMAHSLKAVENMLKANGVVVFSGEKALLKVADYLNKAVSIQGERLQMGEFVKPKRVIVSDKEYIQKLVNANLVKDLHDNEEICPYCHGTGMMIRDNQYGLSDDPDRKVWFPYKHQAITFCQHCFNGVILRCKLCGEVIQRGYTKHDCKQQRVIDEKLRKQKKQEEFDKAPLLPDEKQEDYEYFFSEEYPHDNGYFNDWEEFFDNWENEHEKYGDVRPEYVWVTEPVEMSINAESIAEQATEDLYEDAYDDISDGEIKRLQAILDYWAKTCGVSTTYYESHKYKVKIPWENYDKRKEKE